MGKLRPAVGGFSIVEVLVASSVIMILALGMATSMNFGSRSVQSVSASTDFNSLVTLIESSLGNSERCKNALKEAAWPTPSGVEADIAPPIDVLPLKSDGLAGTEILKAGAYSKNLNVISLKFDHAKPLGVDVYQMRLHLVAEKVVGGGAVGGKALTHDFERVITINPAQGGKFIDCAGSSGAESLWQEAANKQDIYYKKGNVGIGTDTPAYPLDIFSNKNEYKPLRVMNTNAGGAATTGILIQSDATMTQLSSDPSGIGAGSWLQSNSAWGLSLAAYSPTGEIRFWTANSLPNPYRMILDRNGQLGIGSNILPSALLDVAGNAKIAGNVTAGNVNIQEAGQLRLAATGQILFGGTLICSAAGCTSGAPSDRRLKTDIQPLDNSLEKILQLEGMSYQWKDPATYGKGRQLGVMAQDLEKVFPEAVKTDESTGLKSVAYHQLIAPLIEAFKGLFSKTTELEKQVADLSARLDTLSRELAETRVAAERHAVECSTQKSGSKADAK